MWVKALTPRAVARDKKVAAMPEDVEYVVDAKGRKKQVLMSYKAYRQLLEDYADLRVKAERQHEVPEDFDKVLEELRDAGRI